MVCAIAASTAAGAPSMVGTPSGARAAATYPNDNSPLGTGLAEVTDWATEWAFVDVFKTARPWISNRVGAPWGQGGPLQLTPQGWVAALDADQSADTVMFSDTSHHPAGQYVVLYEGQGTLLFDSPTATVVSRAPGRIVLNVAPEPNLWLHLVATTPGDPVRNIRVVMPGFEGTYQSQPFHPLFLQRLARYKALRFTGWLRTDYTGPISWADRTTPEHAFQSRDRGVALEYMVQLANTLHTDAWFNMPYAASDDYLRQFATFVRDRLDPSLKIYLEYSNETWNSDFPQAAYAREQGLALGLSSDPQQAGLRFHARRAVQMFAIWEQVFGGRARLVRVLSAQTSVPSTAVEVMDWQNAYQHADALAIGPYFGYERGVPENVASTVQMSVDQLLDALLAEIRDTRAGTAWMIAQNRANANARGLGMVAYEGGQHLAGVGAAAQGNEQLTALFIAANRSPRMQAIYVEYLNLWRTNGGGIFFHLENVSAPTRAGSWGALEFQDQDTTTAPKYLGLMDFVGAVAGAQPFQTRRALLPLVWRAAG
jgi:hypothetical protein